jgi:hypothetical protein
VLGPSDRDGLSSPWRSLGMIRQAARQEAGIGNIYRSQMERLLVGRR